MLSWHGGRIALTCDVTACGVVGRAAFQWSSLADGKKRNVVNACVAGVIQFASAFRGNLDLGCT